MQLFPIFTAALSFGNTAVAAAVPVEARGVSIGAVNASAPNIVPFPFPEDHVDSLVAPFSAFEELPYDTIDAGRDAVNAWLAAHNYTPSSFSSVNSTPTRRNAEASSAPSTESDIEARQSIWTIVKCAVQIGLFLLEDGVPLARIRRIKELIGVLGGARAVAKLLLKAKSWSQLVIIGGPYLEDLATELLGIKDVATACFSWI